MSENSQSDQKQPDTKAVTSKYSVDVSMLQWLSSKSNLTTPDLSIFNCRRVKLPPLEFINFDSVPKLLAVHNYSKRLSVSGKWCGSRPMIRGGPLLSEHSFIEFHFHSHLNFHKGSFHTVNGAKWPLELHAIFFNKNYIRNNDVFRQTDGIVILSYLFKLQSAPSKSVDKLIGAVRLTRDQRLASLQQEALSAFLWPFEDDYFMYWKKFPGGDVAVKYLICRETFGISQLQLQMLNRISCVDEAKPQKDCSRNSEEKYYLFLVNSRYLDSTMHSVARDIGEKKQEQLRNVNEKNNFMDEATKESLLNSIQVVPSNVQSKNNSSDCFLLINTVVKSSQQSNSTTAQEAQQVEQVKQETPPADDEDVLEEDDDLSDCAVADSDNDVQHSEDCNSSSNNGTGDSLEEMDELYTDNQGVEASQKPRPRVTYEHKDSIKFNMERADVDDHQESKTQNYEITNTELNPVQNETNLVKKLVEANAVGKTESESQLKDSAAIGDEGLNKKTLPGSILDVFKDFREDLNEVMSSCFTRNNAARGDEPGLFLQRTNINVLDKYSNLTTSQIHSDTSVHMQNFADALIGLHFNLSQCVSISIQNNNGPSEYESELNQLNLSFHAVSVELDNIHQLLFCICIKYNTADADKSHSDLLERNLTNLKWSWLSLIENLSQSTEHVRMLVHQAKRTLHRHCQGQCVRVINSTCKKFLKSLMQFTFSVIDASVNSKKKPLPSQIESSSTDNDSQLDQAGVVNASDDNYSDKNKDGVQRNSQVDLNQNSCSSNLAPRQCADEKKVKRNTPSFSETNESSDSCIKPHANNTYTITSLLPESDKKVCRAVATQFQSSVDDSDSPVGSLGKCKSCSGCKQVMETKSDKGAVQGAELLVNASHKGKRRTPLKKIKRPTLPCKKLSKAGSSITSASKSEKNSKSSDNKSSQDRNKRKVRRKSKSPSDVIPSKTNVKKQPTHSYSQQQVKESSFSSLVLPWSISSEAKSFSKGRCCVEQKDAKNCAICLAEDRKSPLLTDSPAPSSTPKRSSKRRVGENQPLEAQTGHGSSPKPPNIRALSSGCSSGTEISFVPCGSNELPSPHKTPPRTPPKAKQQFLRSNTMNNRMQDRMKENLSRGQVRVSPDRSIHSSQKNLNDTSRPSCMKRDSTVIPPGRPMTKPSNSELKMVDEKRPFSAGAPTSASTVNTSTSQQPATLVEPRADRTTTLRSLRMLGTKLANGAPVRRTPVTKPATQAPTLMHNEMTTRNQNNSVKLLPVSSFQQKWMELKKLGKGKTDHSNGDSKTLQENSNNGSQVSPLKSRVRGGPQLQSGCSWTRTKDSE